MYIITNDTVYVGKSETYETLKSGSYLMTDMNVVFPKYCKIFEYNGDLSQYSYKTYCYNEELGFYPNPDFNVEIILRLDEYKSNIEELQASIVEIMFMQDIEEFE